MILFLEFFYVVNNLKFQGVGINHGHSAEFTCRQFVINVF